jgi:hypothetical protein
VNIARKIRKNNHDYVVLSGRAGHVAPMREFRNAHNIFIGNPERKMPLRRPRRRLRILK